MAMAEAAKNATDLALLAQMTSQLERYDLTVRISKMATKRGYLLEAEAYPLPAYSYSSEPEKALVLGIIRQESMFNPTIVSPAQAMGLMQLLPSTAQAEARKLDMAFSPTRLTEPTYNIRLGSRFLADRIEQFDGSWIMAIASYNAGPGRVKQWVQQIGDPRHGVDPIDWIELIPIYETRNYVQRVLEATQIYRARLNNGLSPLTLKQDLRLP
jgi:soluble lytic murein transglycosylase